MKKWIVYLGFLCTCSAFTAEAQVYNQKFDKRFSNEIKSAEHYQTHIQKLQSRLYEDYSSFLTELNFSEAFSRIELLRQDRIKRLNEIRLDLNAKIDYDQQFNDAKHTITKDFNVLIDHYEKLYDNELKRSVELNTNSIDSLHEIKTYLNVLESHVQKAVTARETFQNNFENFETSYDLEVVDKGNIENYSSKQRKLYELGERVSKHESLALYATKIYKDLLIMETIDADFRNSAFDLNEEEMQNAIRYQKNHSTEIFQRISMMEKYNGTENEFKNNALRSVKNYMSNSQKIYISILKFCVDNRTVLVQERKNIDEYEQTLSDKANFKDKHEMRAYALNPPPNKYTLKYFSLIKKYREKTENTLNAVNASYNELVRIYITKYNPINQNF